MASLYIENFLTIKKAEIEFKKINIIIGYQGTGKSIIAKIKYLFDTFLSEELVTLLFSLASKRDIEKKFIANFESIFPAYTWSSQNFTINYFSDEIALSIINKAQGKGRLKLSFTYSDNLDKLISSAKAFHRKNIKSETDKIPSILGSKKIGIDNLQQGLSDLQVFLFDSPLMRGCKYSVFVPASRSFFANFQKNIFLLLVNHINLDPFFPIAQKYITQLFAFLYSTKDSDFLITTHSPYILTALNVLIKAGNLSSQTEDKSLLEKIDRLVERQFHVKYEDVAAYTIKDGRIESILNEEYKIIGSSIIDAVSDEFEHEYNSLLELENEL